MLNNAGSGTEYYAVYMFPQFFVSRPWSQSADIAVTAGGRICLGSIRKSISPQGSRAEWHAARLPWQVELTVVPIALFLLPQPPSPYCVHTHTHTHISDTVQTVYELPLLPDNTAVKHFYTNRGGAKCWLDIYGWSVGLAVTGRIRDIGQNVLLSACVTGGGSGSSTVTATLCCLWPTSRWRLWGKWLHYTLIT